MSELISVCIPTYNNRDVIQKTLQSIINQTYKNIEIVIVDDCSLDETVDIIRSIDDARIVLHRNEQNLGMSGNWNRCVSLAKGEYIKFICADDILEPDCLEKEIAAFEGNEQIVMTICDSKMINEKDECVGTFPRYPKKGIIDGYTLARKSLIESNHFGMPCAVMFKKSVFDKVGGFDSNYHYILDFDLWIRMATHGLVDVLPDKLNHFRLRRDSNTGKVFRNDENRYYGEHKYLLNKYRQQFHLSSLEVAISLASRKIRNWGYGLFLGVLLHGKK